MLTQILRYFLGIIFILLFLFFWLSRRFHCIGFKNSKYKYIWQNDDDDVNDDDNDHGDVSNGNIFIFMARNIYLFIVSTLDKTVRTLWAKVKEVKKSTTHNHTYTQRKAQKK